MRRVFRAVLWLIALTVIGAAVGFLLLLEDRAIVAEPGPPQPEDVMRTRAVVHQIRRAADPATLEDRRIEIAEADAASILRVAGRLARGLRGAARFESGQVHVAAALPVPLPWGQRWLNAEAVALPFVDRPTFERLTVGGIDLPPGPMIALAREGANLVLGNRAGDIFLQSAERLEIADDRIAISLRLDKSEKSAFASGLFGTLRGSDMPAVERIDAYYFGIREAMEAGTLSGTGSYLPYVTWTLARVLEDSTDATLADEYTAAIFALARICGADAFDLVVGRLGRSPDEGRDWSASCEETLFAGRIDTRRHFTTAAAIQAASNRGFSVAVGELKELNDSLKTTSHGFDFSDIAANNAGIRLSNLVMSGTRDDLRRTLALIEAERDLLPDIAAVPQRMPRAEFEARYRDLESPAYDAEIARIERMIDGVTIHQPRS